MNIAIVGVGGVGGYIGAKIKESTEHHISFIAKGRHLDVIKERGLILIDNGKENLIKPDEVTSKSNLLFDLVFVCVKSYDYDSLDILSNLKESSIVVAVGNGVNNSNILSRLLNRKVLNSTIYILSNIRDVGIVNRYSDTFYFVIEDSSDSDTISNILTKAKLKHKMSTNIDYDVWKKYLFISSFASLTSYYEESIGFIVKQKREELELVLNEIVALANSMNIEITQDDIDSTIKQALNIPYESTTSMQLDFKYNRKSELENLVGFVVHSSKERDLSIPNLEKIYNELRLKECKKS